MSAIGYIKLFRTIQNHDIWEDGTTFDRRSAWVDLLMFATFRDRVVNYKGSEINLKRGQLSWSQNKLGERWGWSRKRVNNFLSGLEKRNMILVEDWKKKTTIITIINYERYQRDDTAFHKHDANEMQSLDLAPAKEPLNIQQGNQSTTISNQEPLMVPESNKILKEPLNNIEWHHHEHHPGTTEAPAKHINKEGRKKNKNEKEDIIINGEYSCAREEKGDDDDQKLIKKIQHLMEQHGKPTDTLDMSRVNLWLDAYKPGHILGVIALVCSKAKGKISSLAYFDNALKEAKEDEEGFRHDLAQNLDSISCEEVKKQAKATISPYFYNQLVKKRREGVFMSDQELQAIGDFERGQLQSLG